MSTGRGKPSDVAKVLRMVHAHMPPAPAADKEAFGWQDQFRHFLKLQPKEQLVADARSLRRVFNKAAKYSPTFRKQMEWAKKNGVQFFVDHRCEGPGGYYTPGTGAVAIAARKMKESVASIASVVVHEIRHAWQDVNGLSVTGNNFVERYRGTCLIESDAAAHELCVKEEVERGSHAKIPAAETTHMLWKHFKGWFGSNRPKLYGEQMAQRELRSFFPDKARPKDHKYAFRGFGIPNGFFHVSNDQAVKRLGTMLGGGNYLDHAEAEAFLESTKNVALTKKFYNAQQLKPARMVQRLVRAEQKRRY